VVLVWRNVGRLSLGAAGLTAIAAGAGIGLLIARALFTEERPTADSRAIRQATQSAERTALARRATQTFAARPRRSPATPTATPTPTAIPQGTPTPTPTTFPERTPTAVPRP
jgi:hypothetical protein